MIFIVGVIVILILGAFLVYGGEDLIVGLVAMFIATVLWFFLLNLIALNAPTKQSEVVDTRPLQAINTNSNRGSFFLGGGDERYVFYAKNADGSFSMDSVSSSGTKVFESDTESPKIEEISEVLKWSWLPGSLNEIGSDYIITVPEGSIEPMVDMDLPD